MNIGIIGLGLIGGSMARAIRSNTQHKIFGMDTDDSVVLKAKLFEVIDDELTPDGIALCDTLIIALHPAVAEDWLAANAAGIKKDTVVVDCCGVKRGICALGFELAQKHGFTFIGGHPMAGTEKWGFEYSDGTLFRNASMILTPPADIDIAVLEGVKKFFLSLGFGKVVLSTPEEHDIIIAYTSQLAHVLSSSYIKSDTALKHTGFSAGSFKDMTRVATLSEDMWTVLFLQNRDNLLNELDTLIANLSAYRSVIKSENAAELKAMLREGKERKAFVSSIEGPK